MVPSYIHFYSFVFVFLFWIETVLSCINFYLNKGMGPKCKFTFFFLSMSFGIFNAVALQYSLRSRVPPINGILLQFSKNITCHTLYLHEYQQN